MKARRVLLLHPGLSLAAVLVSQLSWADPARTGEGMLLDDSAYRGEIEEIVVIGQQPEWRKPPESEWRPERFELQQQEPPSRMEWFPKYVKDERDNYDGVNNRLEEKPEIQIFKWNF